MSSITIHIDKKAVRAIEEQANRALTLTAHVLQDEIREEMIVPRDTGHLQNEAFFVDSTEESRGRVRLVFSTPYARRLYYHPEYNFRRDKNPNAQGLWLRPWQRGGIYQNRPQEIFEAILQKGL